MPPIPRRRRTVPGRRRWRHSPSPVGRRRPGAPITTGRRRGGTEAGVKGRGRGRAPVTPGRRSRAKTGAAGARVERRRPGAPVAPRRRRGRAKAGAAGAVSEGRRPAVELRPWARTGRGGQRQGGQRRQRQNRVFPVSESHVNTSFKGFFSAERVWESGALEIAPRIFAPYTIPQLKSRTQG